MISTVHEWKLCGFTTTLTICMVLHTLPVLYHLTTEASEKWNMPTVMDPHVPRIEVDNRDALVDDVIKIRVTGLDKHQQVTVSAYVIDKELKFGSHGCFVADAHGVVDLTSQASIKGTYTGTSPMGLFWSMKTFPGVRKGLRLLKRISIHPLNTTLSVFPGHLTFDELFTSAKKPSASLDIRRWYRSKDVKRIPVREGRVRGMLFLPPGEGPFPGVIDMFGTAGSLIEFRSALLASRGFASLALPYFQYEDLPHSVEKIEMEYFLEAADWLSAHSSVQPGGIGVIGVSKGGELALQMAYYTSKVKAVVSVNGAAFLTNSSIKFGNGEIPSGTYDTSRVDMTEEGISTIRTFDCPKEQYVPLWEREVKTLLIVGEDDMCLDSRFLKEFSECYPEEQRHKRELVVYPGAGHLIEPPYAPLARVTRVQYKGYSEVEEGLVVMILWGGQVVGHAHAQEDSWKRILQFFRRELTPPGVQCMSHYSRL